MGKVVKLEVRDGTVTAPEDVLNLIRLDMYGINVKELAEECGVSATCVYAIRGGRTKWPRGTTLIAILTALGYELRIQRTRNS